MFFTYLSLKDAARIAYQTKNFSDHELIHMPPIEGQDFIGEMFIKRDQDPLYLHKQAVEPLDFRTKYVIDFLGRYIKEGRLSLYGEKYPDTKKVKIPFLEIKNWSRNFTVLYKDDSFSKTFGEGDRPIASYQNVCVKRKELKVLLEQLKA